MARLYNFGRRAQSVKLKREASQLTSAEPPRAHVATKADILKIVLNCLCEEKLQIQLCANSVRLLTVEDSRWVRRLWYLWTFAFMFLLGGQVALVPKQIKAPHPENTVEEAAADAHHLGKVHFLKVVRATGLGTKITIVEVVT